MPIGDFLQLMGGANKYTTKHRPQQPTPHSKHYRQAQATCKRAQHDMDIWIYDEMNPGEAWTYSPDVEPRPTQEPNPQNIWELPQNQRSHRNPKTPTRRKKNPNPEASKLGLSPRMARKRSNLR